MPGTWTSPWSSTAPPISLTPVSQPPVDPPEGPPSNPYGAGHGPPPTRDNTSKWVLIIVGTVLL